MDNVLTIVVSLIPFLYYGLIIGLIIWLMRLLKNFKDRIATLENRIEQLEKKGN